MTAYIQKYIQADDIHSIAYKIYGNKHGTPIFMLHGGPGGRISERLIGLIDLSFYKVIAIDQRGCGASTPHGCLENNTTHDLISDIELIRQKENIEKIIFFARSWGTTLALLYAIKFPQNCSCLVLRGIFLARQEDENATFVKTKEFFPKEWSDFSQGLDVSKLNEDYYSKLFNSDINIAQEYNERLINYFELLFNNIQEEHILSNPSNLLSSKIFLHYSVNGFFIEDDYFTKNLSRINDISGYIIHGEQDRDCNVNQAYFLHENWKKSKCCIHPNATHSDRSNEIINNIESIFIERQELVKKTDE